MSVLRLCAVLLAVTLIRVSSAEVNVPVLDDPSGRIDRVEYFFDDDPGLGEGLELPFEEEEAGSVDMQFRPDLTDLEFGVHTLVVRARNLRGEWSLFKTHPFYYVPYGVGQSVELARTEYFLDEDPGLGRAQPIELVPGEGHQFEIDLSDVPSGSRRRALGVRSSDSFGNWGLLRRFEFVKVPEIRATAIDWALFEGEVEIGGGRQALIPATSGLMASIDSGLLAPGAAVREVTATVSLVLDEKIATETLSSGFSVEWVVNPLLFLAQPESVSVMEGDPISLVAEVGGTPPFVYQWLKNDSPIPGANGNRLNISTASSSNAGLYSVTVIDAFGELTSDVARVDVEEVPVVVTGEPHPADRNEDWQLSISEVTAYGAVWKRGEAWPVEPSSIPISYVTRAGALWKTGEVYEFDSSVAVAPLWWVSASAGLQRNGMTNGGVAVSRQLEEDVMTITLDVGTGVRSYAFEEVFSKPVNLLSVSNGALSKEGRHIRWGPFTDGQKRVLRYRIDERSFEDSGNHRSGFLSYDGFVRRVPGEDGDEYAGLFEPRVKFDAGMGGLRLRGFQSKTVVIQATQDLGRVPWEKVESLVVEGEDHLWIDTEFERRSQRFYRVLISSDGGSVIETR